MSFIVPFLKGYMKNEKAKAVAERERQAAIAEAEAKFTTFQKEKLFEKSLETPDPVKVVDTILVKANQLGETFEGETGQFLANVTYINGVPQTRADGLVAYTNVKPYTPPTGQKIGDAPTQKVTLSKKNILKDPRFENFDFDFLTGAGDDDLFQMSYKDFGNKIYSMDFPVAIKKTQDTQPTVISGKQLNTKLGLAANVAYPDDARIKLNPKEDGTFSFEELKKDAKDEGLYSKAFAEDMIKDIRKHDPLAISNLLNSGDEKIDTAKELLETNYGNEKLFEIFSKIEKVAETDKKGNAKDRRSFGGEGENSFSFAYNSSNNDAAQASNVSSALRSYIENEELVTKLIAEGKDPRAQLISYLGEYSTNLGRLLQAKEGSAEFPDFRGGLNFNNLEAILGTASPELQKFFSDNKILDHMANNTMGALAKRLYGVNAGKLTAIGQDEDGLVNGTQVPLDEFKTLATTLGTTPNDLIQSIEVGYPHLITPDMEVFRLAQELVEIDGFARTDPSGATSIALRDRTTKQIANRKMLKQVSVKLATSNLDKVQRVQALGLAIGKPVPLKKDTGGRDFKTLFTNIKLVTGFDFNKSSDTQKFQERLTTGREVRDLITEYQSIINTGTTRVGIAGTLDKFLATAVGKDGQLTSIKDVIFGVEQNEFSFDQEDLADDETGKDLKLFIDSYIKGSEKAGLKAEKAYNYGRMAALRIFLAYKMAKYFDPSGRVSDQDLKNQLDAFAGGSFDNKFSINGMLDAALDRVNAKLSVDEMFEIDDVSKIDQRMFSNLQGALAYKKLVTESVQTTADTLLNYKVDLGLDKLDDTGVKVKYIDDEGIERTSSIFIVRDKVTIDPKTGENYLRFENYGGLTMIKTGPSETDYEYRKLYNFDLNAYKKGVMQDTISSDVDVGSVVKIPMPDGTFIEFSGA